MAKKRSKKGIVLMVLIIGAFILSAFAISGDVQVHGYDGIVGTMENVSGVTGTGTEYLETSSAGIDAFHFLQSDPTGVRMEIQSGVNILNYEQLETIQQTEELADNKLRVKDWSVQKVKCKMGATVMTYGSGADPAYDITFTVRLSENDFSVFSDADQQEAYILNVYTRDAPVSTGVMDTVPRSGGYDFPLTSASADPIPSWITEAGYTGTLVNLKSVTFDIKVEKAQPDTFFGLYRTETQAEFDIGVDVLLFGYWEQVVDSRDWETPPPVPWFVTLGAWINSIMDFFTPIVIMVIVIGVVIIFVYITKLKRR